ncbi:hypothetical protein [Streptomyces sp. NPDC014006]|uniref:hypothetical protein n=1 Tax=Streptomyces sp. NPDC014006 TaxID=3364870 RepID=UPI0037014034
MQHEENVNALWEGLENGAFAFVSALRERGFDLVLLGFGERSASILDNAEAPSWRARPSPLRTRVTRSSWQTCVRIMAS